MVAMHLSSRYNKSNESSFGQRLGMDGVNLVCSVKYPVHIFSRNAEYRSCLPIVMLICPPGGSTMGLREESSVPGRLYAEGIIKILPSDVSNFHPVIATDSDLERLAMVIRSLNGSVLLPLKLEILICL